MQARTASAHVSRCTPTLVLVHIMKLYMLACLLAIASSAALESATPTKKAPPKVDPVALSTANTASEATHSRATHSHHHQDKHATTITNITTAAVTIHPSPHPLPPLGPLLLSFPRHRPPTTYPPPLSLALTPTIFTLTLTPSLTPTITPATGLTPTSVPPPHPRRR